MKVSTRGTYYGLKRYEWDSNGLLFSEYDYHQKGTDWHYHENPYFMYLLQGDLSDENHKTKTACPSGSLLLCNWEEPHKNTRESETARGFHIEFERKWFENKRLDINLWEGSQILADPRLHSTVARIYYEFKCGDSWSPLTLDTLVLQLCEQVETGELSTLRSAPPWVTKLKELLLSEERPHSLEELSGQLQVHPGHISRAIPKYFQTTLGDYVRRQKIGKALGLLGKRSLSLTEISYACGFADQSHFTRTFKRYQGVGPKQYRKELLGWRNL